MDTGAGTGAEPRRRGFAARYVRVLAWVLAVLVVLGGLVLAFDADERDHLLGRSEATLIDVVSVDRQGRCGGRKSEFAFDYVVEGDSTIRSDTECSQFPPRTGTRTAWVTGSGAVRLDDPTTHRVVVALLPFFIALLLTAFGSRFTPLLERLRRRG